MTERLYYHDSHTTQFTATIVEQVEIDGKFATILDKSYFYPTGGGQPHDTGMINGIPVVDVITRDDDYAILHITETPVDGIEVSCSIDWKRRFDHMQHHTGQHILTQAFVQLGSANTVAFHLGSDSITIDVDQPNLSDTLLVDVENLVNQIITENRPVRMNFIDSKDAEEVRMRKMPDNLTTDTIRVIDVEGFDQTACGGTHVHHTGEIGLLKIIKVEKRGENSRVEFRCGERAFEDYRQKHQIISALGTRLTRGHWELEEAITQMMADLKITSKSLQKAQSSLLGYRADSLIKDTPIENGLRLISLVLDENEGNARDLVSQLVEHPQTVCIVGVYGEKSQFIAGRSSDLAQDMREVIGEAFTQLDGARGGGRPDFAQGGGFTANKEAISQAIEVARTFLMS